MVEMFFSVLILTLLTFCFRVALSFGIAGMFRKVIRNLILIICLIVLCSAPALDEAKAWTFAVIGDSRAKDHKDPEHPGVNWKVLRNIAEGIDDIKPKVDLVIFTGDLILGGNSGHQEKYEDWANAMIPILNSNIPIYTVRGNHEEWGDPNATEWRKFVRKYLPNLLKLRGSPKGEELCTYRFTHKNALFISVDEYFHRKGKKHTINQAWLNKQLESNDRNTHPHIFVYSHTPAFKVSGRNSHDCPGSGSTGALYCDKTVRDKLWTSLRDNGVRVYFCGHVHFYTANKIKNYQPQLYQIVNGLGGAGLDEYHANVDKDHVIYGEHHSIVEAKNIGGHYGYNMVHVDGNKVRIDLMVWHNTKKYWETKKGIYKGSYTVN